MGRYRIESQRELIKLWREIPIGKARMSTEQMVTIFIRIAPVFKIMNKIQKMSLSQLAHPPSEQKYLELSLVIQESI